MRDAVTAMDIIALTSDSAIQPELINTDRAPMPAGRYPQAVKAGPSCSRAGKIPTDFATWSRRKRRSTHNFPYFGRSIKRQTAFILRISLPCSRPLAARSTMS